MAELTPAGDAARSSAGRAARKISVGSVERMTKTLKAWSST